MLKKIWAHKTTHLIVVLVVFALTGTTVAKMTEFLIVPTGLQKYSPLWWLVAVPLMTLIYPCFLLGYGALFGKFAYFFQKQKHLWQKIRSLFRGRSQK